MIHNEQLLQTCLYLLWYQISYGLSDSVLIIALNREVHNCAVFQLSIKVTTEFKKL